MTREQLEHAIRAACDVAGDTEVWVFGSQSVLGQHPGAPGALRRSEEADITPKNRPERTDLVDGALGQDSLFHRTHGFYVHGVPIGEAATLPDGWQRRAIPVRNPNTRDCTGWCLEAHDLAISKLAAFRDKDREFVRLMLRENLVDGALLAERLKGLRLAPDRAAICREWLAGTRRELGR